MNDDHEIRLVAELDEQPVGIGALALERSELRGLLCFAHDCSEGVWFRASEGIERIAKEQGLDAP